MKKKHERNIPSITADEQHALSGKKVAVIGCGGLGGYLAEFAARCGIGTIVAADGDVFDETNLNRQLLSDTGKIGTSKADAAKERIALIDPDIRVIAYNGFFNEENAADILNGCDAVLDGLDNAHSRLLLEDVCAKLGIPIVHGAVYGWNYQVTVSLPGSGTLHRMYGSAPASASSDPASKTVLAFTCAACSAVQAAECIKLLLGRESGLAGRLLLADLASPEYIMPVFN